MRKLTKEDFDRIIEVHAKAFDAESNEMIRNDVNESLKSMPFQSFMLQLTMRSLSQLSMGNVKDLFTILATALMMGIRLGMLLQSDDNKVRELERMVGEGQ